MILMLIIAIVLWALAGLIALSAFGIEHTPDTVYTIFALLSWGLVAFALSFVPWPNVPRYFRR